MDILHFDAERVSVGHLRFYTDKNFLKDDLTIRKGVRRKISHGKDSRWIFGIIHFIHKNSGYFAFWYQSLQWLHLAKNLAYFIFLFKDIIIENYLSGLARIWIRSISDETDTNARSIFILTLSLFIQTLHPEILTDVSRILCIEFNYFR